MNLAVWIWERAAWFEPQSVASTAWLDLQAMLLFIPIGFIVIGLLPRRRRP